MLLTLKMANYLPLLGESFKIVSGHSITASSAKENTSQSWTAVFDAGVRVSHIQCPERRSINQTLETIIDQWHEGRVISERLIWYDRHLREI